jgi:hypothetical protein
MSKYDFLNRPFSYYIPLLNESYKKAAGWRLRAIMEKFSCQVSENIPSLDETFLMLGKATARLNLIRDTIQLIIEGEGRTLLLSKGPRELIELERNCVEQCNTLNQMVKGILQEEAKNAHNRTTVGEAGPSD